MPGDDAHAHRLPWVPDRAPYMPVASVGLLQVLRSADPGAALGWPDPGDPFAPPVLTLRTRLSIERTAEEIVSAPWPRLDALEWPARPSQAIKPSLHKQVGDAEDGMAAVHAWRALAGLPPGSDSGRVEDVDRAAAHALVAALLTDGVLDESGLPGRNRLLRGVKSDLSGVAKPPKAKTVEIADELKHGMAWTSGSSGLGLGLVPEVQTFGGTTGPTPSAVGAYSKLLYYLCWHGIMAMPPYAVRRGPQTIVGGPLFADAATLSWPIWSMPLRRTALIALFGLEPVHAPEPDRELLRAHGIQAVFRSRAREINTMISVFGWGDRVA
ncbi:MAG TPA: hypothetical protein VG898_00105 [Solirubrobacterales bacterium]|nr:hypothetical protein [Solirubrobacterales bacterium]